MTGNRLSNENSAAIAEGIEELDAKHRFIEPHFP